MDKNKIIQGVMFVAFLLFSGVIHELCHALAADYFGDPTPRMNERLTLNPVPHISLMWTIIMPVVILVMSNFTFAFGGAKPVQMNPARFRHPERDFTIAAAVGPLSNFALAIIPLAVLLVLPFRFKSGSVLNVLFIFYLANIILGLFNLIPIPPLDGSRVVRYFLSREMKETYDQLSGPAGIMVILGLEFGSRFILGFSLIWLVLNPVMEVFQDLFYYFARM